MDKLFVNFLPPWVETNIQPAFYDKESGSVLQQTARMYAKVNCLVRMFNKLSKETKETVDEYVAKFVELKDFVDTYFENLDVQEEINNKLDEMAESGELQDLIFNYIGRIAVVNVRYYGVVGDGVTDDYEAIQTAINNNPMKTLHFDEGTYLISQHLSLPATDNEKVFLELDPNATIKADGSFTDDFLIMVGETGTAASYGNSKHQTGVSGGILDCNGRTSGIKSEKTHLARFTNLDILNCQTIGIQIDQSNNVSSDAFLSNVNLSGVDGNDMDTIGVLLNGYDNNMEMVRTNGFHTGFYINGGGNYLSNCHPLYSNTLSGSNYNSSVAFNIIKQDATLTDCYADNFSTGIKCTDVSWYATNFFCYWYDNDATHDHTIITCTTTTFLGKIDGINMTFPSLGTNRGMVVADSEHPSVYYPLAYTRLSGDMRSGSITNVHLSVQEWNKMTNKYVDPILSSDLQCHNNFCLRGTDDNIESDKYYPIMIIPQLGGISNLNTRHYDVDFFVTNNFHLDFSFYISNNILHMTRVNTVFNIDNVGYSFALAKPSGMNNAYILYIKFNKAITASNRIFSTTIKNTGSGLRMTLIPRDGVYSNPAINGIDTLDGSLGTTEEYQNQNSNNGIFATVNSWKSTHTIKIKDTFASASTNQRPVVMFCRWGNSTAMYAFYNGYAMPLDESHKSSYDSISFSYDSDTGFLTVTYDKTGIINYLKF